MRQALGPRRGPPGVSLLGSAAASLGDTQMRNLKPGWVPGVRIIQMCGLARVPWVGQWFFIPKHLSAPQSHTHWPGYPRHLLPHHASPRLSHTHTHTRARARARTRALPHLPCSITVLSSQQPTSQNLTKKSEETGRYNVPKNTYKDPKLGRTRSPVSVLPSSHGTHVGRSFFPPPEKATSDSRQCPGQLRV